MRRATPIWLLVTSFTWACEEGPSASRLVEHPTREGADVSWEEFRDSATRIIDGGTIFVVEWDLVIESEEDLHEYYENTYAHRGGGHPLIVNQIGGQDDVWHNQEQLHLTYCVSDAFGAVNQPRAIAEMLRAASDWESVVNVDFRYDPSQNGNCFGSNLGVDFAVRPWTYGGACAFFPSGGGCITRTLVMDYTDLDTNPFFRQNAPNVSTVGVLRHELGHILGFRHEHIRPHAQPTSCGSENLSWRELTKYDNRSVMHYPWCNGVLTSDFSITGYDARGAIAIYGPSASLMLSWLPIVLN